MNLGEKIYQLRNLHKMSQGDLAEKLNVSRQSISKWENNTSIPELDKLVQLSELFQITLDELVKGKDVTTKKMPSEEISNPKESIIEKEESKSSVSETKNISGIDANNQGNLNQQSQMTLQHSMSTQKIVGFILLAIGLLSCILAFGFGEGLAVIGAYIILCSIICLLVKKHAGLVIGWMTFLQALLLIPQCTGIRILAVFHLGYWDAVTMNHIFAVSMWIALAVLLFFSFLAILKKRK